MLEQDQIRRLKDRHGEDLIHVTIDDVTLVFRRPSRADYKSFQDNLAKGVKPRSACFEQFCQNCFVYPEGDAGQPDFHVWSAALDRRPALATKIGSKLIDLAGLDDDIEVGNF